MKQAQSDFLGTGWGFPPAFSKGGEDVLMVSREEDIVQSLLILLGTSLDERAMREDYGCNLRDYLFEELDPRLLNQLRNAISNSVRLHEPRINLEDINFDVQADYAQSLINIEIQFLVRSTNSRYNMVYPFYLTEGAQASQYMALPPTPENRLLKGSTPLNRSETEHRSFKTSIHKSTSENTVENKNSTSINLPDLDENAILFVSSVWGDQYSGTTNRERIGVHFTDNAWHIYNLNPDVPMGIGHSFHLLIAPKNLPNAFVHTAGMGNLSLDTTFIHHPLANGRPEARLLVTPRFTETQLHDIAVGYNVEKQRWFIRRIPEASPESPNLNIQAGASFNVLITNGDQLLNLESYEVGATAENKIQTGFVVDILSLNFNPDARVFHTQLWRPGLSVSGPLEWWYDHPGDGYEGWKNNYWFLYRVAAESSYIPPGLGVFVFVIPKPSTTQT
jgi:uncharacterized protein